MNYISKQLAGPIIQGFSAAIEQLFNTVYMPILNYFLSLSITSANEAHINMIGTLMGFPRPLVQQALVDSAYFKFSVSYYRDIDLGFGLSYAPLGNGGLLSPVLDYSNLTYLDIATYKAMLKIIGTAKWVSSNYSLELIDNICKYVAGNFNYVIAYSGIRNDISITFYNLNAYSVYIAGYILNYLFDNEPDITVIREIV